jgi:hypothetical protein
VASTRAKVLVLAARQPEFVELLEEGGFEVEARTRPLGEGDEPDADLAVVFRGRLIGRNQASALAERGLPVIEILTVEPPGVSSGHWIRLSNRLAKSDLVQIVHAAVGWARDRTAVPT